MNGASFSTYVAVAEDGFNLIGDSLHSHNVTDSAKKHFCKICGTPIYNTNPKYFGLTILHFGSLDSPAGLVPQINIYCESQLDWIEKLPDIASLEQGL